MSLISISAGTNGVKASATSGRRLKTLTGRLGQHLVEDRRQGGGDVRTHLQDRLRLVMLMPGQFLLDRSLAEKRLRR